MRRSLLSIGLLAALLCCSPPAGAEEEPPPGPSLFGRPVDRGGFHAQILFGLGAGPDVVGLFHTMELGWTFRGGSTLGLIHAFIQNDGVFTTLGGPDLIGGWMLLYKVPVILPELVYKVGLGPGGIHDQSDGITAHWGPAWLYGFDLHFPAFYGSGPTLSLVALHAVALTQHHFGVSLGLGYTFF